MTKYNKRKYKQIPLRAADSLVWNDLTGGSFVVVTRTVKKEVYHYYGEITQMEKLRNCFMMHLKVWEIWRDGTDGRELNIHDWNDLLPSVRGGRGARNYRGLTNSEARWKKQGAGTVRPWDPTKAMTGTTTSYNLPSKKTFERFQKEAQDREINEKLRARARNRQAHVKARSLMNTRRDALADALSRTGLTFESSFAEFKRARRDLMIDWHPDKEQVFIANGGTKAEFDRQSKLVLHALSQVQHSLFN